MADDKQVANRKLEELLMALGGDRRYLKAYRDKGDAAGVERCEQLLKAYHSRIREHCAEHDLDLPHDVPPEAHPTTSDTE